MDGFLGDLLDFTFTRFITIKWVKLIFIIGLAVLVLGAAGIAIFGLITLFTGDGFAGKMAGLFMICAAAIGLLFYAIALRIYMELIVVLFRIEEHTRVMAGGTVPSTHGFPVIPVNPPAQG
jgi:uncharacterized protein DUF4282